MTTPDANGRDPLEPAHRRHLYLSGLTDATIEAFLFRSATDPHEIAGMLGWAGPAAGLGPVLVIPYFDRKGRRIPYGRLRPDHPRKDEDGDPIKYEAPIEEPPRVYFPPGFVERWNDTSLPVVVVEGEKKTAAGWQHGYLCLGVPGVWSWRRHGQALPDLDALHWAGRKAFVCFDSDAATKDHVRRAETRLAQTLEGLGATVRIVRLPPGPPDANGEPGKVGLDDFLKAHGPAAFNRLMAEAQKPPAGKVTYRSLPPWQTFPTGRLPDPLADLTRAAAAAIGCDPGARALPLRAPAAGCIGNSRSILLKRGWVEACVLWAVTVAESGDLKSPAADVALSPLHDLQVEEVARWKQAEEAHHEDLEDWTALEKSARGKKPKPPPPPARYITSDATVEALGRLLALNPHGLLLARDELDAWFSSLTRYRVNGSDRAQWLELHRASTIFIDRVGRGMLSVPRAGVSLTGTVQPSILARGFDDEALSSGLAARFLLAMPPVKNRTWTECELPDALVTGYRSLLQELLALNLKDADRRQGHVVNLSAEAKEEWVRFFNAWNEERLGTEGAVKAAFAKIEGYAARLSLLHHVVTQVHTHQDTLADVALTSIQAGITLARWFAGEAIRLYSMLGESREQRQVRALVELIRRQGGQITPRGLMRANCRRYPDTEAAEAALQTLVDGGLAFWREVCTGPRGGRPTRVCILCMTHDTTDTTPSDDGVVGEDENRGPDDTTSDTAHTTSTNDGFSAGSGSCVRSVMRHAGGTEANTPVLSDTGQSGGAPDGSEVVSSGPPSDDPGQEPIPGTQGPPCMTHDTTDTTPWQEGEI